MNARVAQDTEKDTCGEFRSISFGDINIELLLDGRGYGGCLRDGGFAVHCEDGGGLSWSDVGGDCLRGFETPHWGGQ